MVSRFDEDPFQHSRNRDVQLLNRMDQHDVYGTSSSFNNSILLTGGSSSNNNNDILAVLEEGTSTSNTTVRTNSSITATTKPAKRKRESTLRKAPGAPKRFKSSYILFFMAHRDEIKNELGAHASVSDCVVFLFLFLPCVELLRVLILQLLLMDKRTMLTIK
jgi:hypothetical protein